MGWTSIAVALACSGCGRLWFDPIDDGLGGGDGGAGDGDGRPLIVDGAVPGVDVNVAFVTAADVIPGALGGISGADARCQADADAAGLPGTYIAWLSTGTMNAIDRLAGSRGWVRPDGLPLFDQPADLVARGVLAPISLRADGQDIVYDTFDTVISATNDDGTANTQGNCMDWTSTAGTTYLGSSQSTSYWTQIYLPFTGDCGSPQRMYCMGVGKTVPVPTLPVTGRRAFLSTQISSGGGISALDALCQSDADASALGGSWRAFVATATASAASRFAPSGAVWVRLDGTPLAPSASEVLSLGFRVPLNVKADGTYVNALVANVWTGGATPAELGPASCSSWTSTIASMDAETGSYNHAAERAMSWSPTSCNLNRPVYCLEP